MSMTPIFNSRREYHGMHICEFGDSSPNLLLRGQGEYHRILSQNVQNEPGR